MHFIPDPKLICACGARLELPDDDPRLQYECPNCFASITAPFWFSLEWLGIPDVCLNNVADAMSSQLRSVINENKDESPARRDLREALFAAGYVPRDELKGTACDLNSPVFLTAWFSFWVSVHRCWVQWSSNDCTDFYSCAELVQLTCETSQSFLTAKWKSAGGVLTHGRRIAYLNDPVWLRLSEFGWPHPQFGFLWKSGVLDIDIDEVERVRVPLPKEHFDLDQFRHSAPCEKAIDNPLLLLNYAVRLMRAFLKGTP